MKTQRWIIVEVDGSLVQREQRKTSRECRLDDWSDGDSVHNLWLQHIFRVWVADGDRQSLTTTRTELEEMSPIPPLRTFRFSTFSLLCKGKASWDVQLSKKLLISLIDNSNETLPLALSGHQAKFHIIFKTLSCSCIKTCIWCPLSNFL